MGGILKIVLIPYPSQSYPYRPTIGLSPSELFPPSTYWMLHGFEIEWNVGAKRAKGGRRPPFARFAPTFHSISNPEHSVMCCLLRFYGLCDSWGAPKSRPRGGVKRRPNGPPFDPPSRPGFWGSRVRLPGQGRPRFLPPFSRSISGRKKRKKSHLHPKLLNQALLRGAGAPWAPVAGGPPRGLGGYPLTLLGLGQGSSHTSLANRGFGASNGRPEAPICQ